MFQILQSQDTQAHTTSLYKGGCRLAKQNFPKIETLRIKTVYIYISIQRGHNCHLKTATAVTTSQSTKKKATETKWQRHLRER